MLMRDSSYHEILIYVFEKHPFTGTWLKYMNAHLKVLNPHLHIITNLVFINYLTHALPRGKQEVL